MQTPPHTDALQPHVPGRSDADLHAIRQAVSRWAGRGPRYTSYPTAPHFREDTDWAAVRERWASATAGLSLYVHVPWCERRCLYCGCHVLIARDRALGTRYVDRLLDQLDQLGALTDIQRPLGQVALGGGTPTWLLPDDLARLVEGIRERTAPADESEWSIELDPRAVDAAYIERLCGLGFNRFSLGVQDLDPDVGEAIGRKQMEADVVAAIDAIRAHSDAPINLDVMFGLPRQTAESFARTIDRVIELAPERIALFGYAHVPWLKKHQRGMERHGLPDAQARLARYLEARARLLEAGYVSIGMDHFALPDDAMARALVDGSLHRNFMGYTTRAGLDLIGLGASAIGAVNGTFVQNAKELGRWSASVDSGSLVDAGSSANAGARAAPGMPGPGWWKGAVLDAEDKLRSDVIMSLMCGFSVERAAIESRHGVAFDAHFADALAKLTPMADDGLLVDDGERIALTPVGALLVRNVAMAFDAYLGQGSGRFSKTV